MKILIVSMNHAPELTGIGKYVGEMTDWLDAQGAEVRVVTAPPYYPEWKIAAGYARGYSRERRGRSLVFRCPLYVPRRPTGARRLLHLASFAVSSAPAILWQALAWRPDVVLAIEPPLLCSPVALAGAKLAGARSWLHVQDFEVDAAFDLGLLGDGRGGGRLRRAVERLERALLGAFDRVSTISAAMDARLAAKGVPGERRSVFPNWVDTEAVRPHAGPSSFREQLALAPDTRVALYSGNLGRKQGLDVVVEAARAVASDPRLVFVICGDGAERESLQRAAAGLGNVRFLPLQPLDRLNDLLNLADVHLLPQRAEAEGLVMPSKLAAMMATGRPVVATADPRSEIARALDGGGVVVPPGDARALAGAVVALCDDERRRATLGAAARAYARTHWDKDAVLAAAFGPRSIAALPAVIGT